VMEGLDAAVAPAAAIVVVITAGIIISHKVATCACKSPSCNAQTAHSRTRGSFSMALFHDATSAEWKIVEVFAFSRENVEGPKMLCIISAVFSSAKRGIAKVVGLVPA
jgi:hypothetical protein